MRMRETHDPPVCKHCCSDVVAISSLYHDQLRYSFPQQASWAWWGAASLKAHKFSFFSVSSKNDSNSHCGSGRCCWVLWVSSASGELLLIVVGKISSTAFCSDSSQGAEGVAGQEQRQSVEENLFPLLNLKGGWTMATCSEVEGRAAGLFSRRVQSDVMIGAESRQLAPRVVQRRWILFGFCKYINFLHWHVLLRVCWPKESQTCSNIFFDWNRQNQTIHHSLFDHIHMKHHEELI